MLQTAGEALPVHKHDHCIEPYGAREQAPLGQPPDRGGPQSPRLAGSDRLQAGAVFFTAASFDLNDDHLRALPADQIEFARRGALIPGQNAVPSSREIGGRHLLPRPPSGSPVDVWVCVTVQVGLLHCGSGALVCFGQANEGVGLDTSDFGRTLATDSAHISAPVLAAFRATVLDHYRAHGRDLPWRRTHDPYRILVSEVMLQQTQVIRVLGKYEPFIAAFPQVSTLAASPIAAVLRVWQGLGYNRRALALHRAAQIMVAEHQGLVPRSLSELRSLPGVGPATVGAVAAFAYDLALPFVETNIRSAFLHFFFQECVAVPDADILTLVELTLDHENPRTWYYALMDYGVWVKKNYPNPSRRSRHHSTQTAFVGSRRQLRAQILRALLATPLGPSADPGAPESATVLDIAQIAARSPAWDLTEVHAVLGELTAEGFLFCSEGRYRIA
jgi:A/G-specific adenine glycosylase